MHKQETHFRLLVTVKAYPSVSTKYNELVCCAGITDAKRWVRWYPVPYRDLPGHKHFEKYDIVEVDALKRDAYKDDRPESWQPILETMRIVGHVDVKQGNWDARLEWIKPSLFPGFGHLQELQEKESVSLGAFKPAGILGVEVSPDDKSPQGQTSFTHSRTLVLRPAATMGGGCVENFAFSARRGRLHIYNLDRQVLFLQAVLPFSKVGE